MQNALKSNEWQTLWVNRTFKIEKKKGEPNNSDFLQNWFLPENRSFLLNLKKFQNSDKSSSESYRTLLKANEWRRFCVLKNLKLKYRRGDQIIQIFCRIDWFSQEIRSALFSLWKSQKSEKGTPESSRIHRNLKNDQEFGSLALLKMKYRRGDQIIQTYCRIGSPQKLDPPFNL